MRRESLRGAIALIAPVLIAGSCALPSYADATPSPTPDAYQSALNQYKVDRDLYLSSLKSRAASIKAINKAFNEAISKANSDFAGAISQAKTPAQKFALTSQRMSAKSAAIAARDAAIAALGPAPIEPTEPPASYSMKSPSKQGKNKKK